MSKEKLSSGLKRIRKFFPEFVVKKRSQRPSLFGSQLLGGMIVRIVSVLLGLVLVAVIFIMNGINPIELYVNIFSTAFFTEYGITSTLTYFIPLLCISVGLAIPFRAKIDNIGAEGQFLMGTIAATWAAFTFAYLPAYLLIPIIFGVGFLAGALWALPVAIFRVVGEFKGSDVVLSFLLVFPPLYLVNYLVSGPWRDPEGWGFTQTAKIPENAQIPTLGNTTVHVTIFLVVAITLIVYYLVVRTKKGIPKTKLGYEINVMGENAEAGEAAGISYLKIAVITMLLSGGLAGLAGVGELAGHLLRLRPEISTGLGFTGIAVAWLGGLNPIGILVSSIFFGGLLAGGVEIQIMGMPFSTVDMFNGAILFFVLAAEFFMRYRIVWRRNK
ncbi:MAG: ABC transporter permease [Candidatus Thorarchaeota archaeon]